MAVSLVLTHRGDCQQRDTAEGGQSAIEVGVGLRPPLNRLLVNYSGKAELTVPLPGSHGQFGLAMDGLYQSFPERREAQLDIGLVDRVTRGLQIGIFSSYEYAWLTPLNHGAGLAQASGTIDFLLPRFHNERGLVQGVRLGVFGSKALRSQASIGSLPLGSGFNAAVSAAVPDQAGGRLQIGFVRLRKRSVVAPWLELQGAYLSSTSRTTSSFSVGERAIVNKFDPRPYTIFARAVFPIAQGCAAFAEYGINESLSGFGQSIQRLAIGIRFGSVFKPQDAYARTGALAAQVPRIHYRLPSSGPPPDVVPGVPVVVPPH
jgi:hypothetical protein